MALYARGVPYHDYKPRRRRSKRISDKTFWRGIAVLTIFTAWALWRSYNFFIG